MLISSSRSLLLLIKVFALALQPAIFRFRSRAKTLPCTRSMVVNALLAAHAIRRLRSLLGLTPSICCQQQDPPLSRVLVISIMQPCLNSSQKHLGATHFRHVSKGCCRRVKRSYDFKCAQYPATLRSKHTRTHANKTGPTDDPSFFPLALGLSSACGLNLNGGCTSCGSPPLPQTLVAGDIVFITLGKECGDGKVERR